MKTKNLRIFFLFLVKILTAKSKLSLFLNPYKYVFIDQLHVGILTNGDLDKLR